MGLYFHLFDVTWFGMGPVAAYIVRSSCIYPSAFTDRKTRSKVFDTHAGVSFNGRRSVLLSTDILVALLYPKPSTTIIGLHNMELGCWQ
jgi:hypothetical protein